MKVSVIIPVYNAADYLPRAVESVLEQPYVEEIVIVEDASPDNALSICRDYAERYAHVKLVQHTNGENRGAGETRNLGLRTASCNWVAFLDADDYYLPKRFEETHRIIQNHPDADGVYEAVKNVFETEEQKEQFVAQRPPKFLTDPFRAVGYHVFDMVPPEELFNTLIKGGSGFIHLNGLTLRKQLVDKIGGFHPNLPIMQDTHFNFKAALAGKLYNGGSAHFVAERFLHKENRITNKDDYELSLARLKMFKTLYGWAIDNIKLGIDTKSLQHIIWRIEQSEKKVGVSSFVTLYNKVFRKFRAQIAS